jgi:hypothetical protein
LAVGIVGGLVGALVRRYYEQNIAMRYFPSLVPPAHTRDNIPDPVEQRAFFPPQHRSNETCIQTSARVLYNLLTGDEPPKAETQAVVENLVELAQGVAAGATYGGTRTTTRARDIAGGFFYGIRLWLGETLVAALLGLRAGPTRYSLEQHSRLLTAYWVYTFTTTTVTRLLYRLFSPEDW